MHDLHEMWLRLTRFHERSFLFVDNMNASFTCPTGIQVQVDTFIFLFYFAHDIFTL